MARRNEDDDTNGGIELDTKHNSTIIDAKLPRRTMPWEGDWQLGTAERHGGLWKEIFAKVTDEFSVTEADLHLCITAVNAAKNQIEKKQWSIPQPDGMGTRTC